jgi:hypothetical protein
MAGCGVLDCHDRPPVVAGCVLDCDSPLPVVAGSVLNCDCPLPVVTGRIILACDGGTVIDGPELAN